MTTIHDLNHKLIYKMNLPSACSCLKVLAGMVEVNCVAQQSKATMATKQATKNVITIKGSAEIVAEFFGYSVNRLVLVALLNGQNLKCLSVYVTSHSTFAVFCFKEVFIHRKALPGFKNMGLDCT